MDVNDWQKRLGDTFGGGSTIVGPSLLEVLGGEEASGLIVANTFHGLFTLSSCFQSFYYDTLRLVEKRSAPKTAVWYWPVVFTHVSIFKVFRGAEDLFLRGYPLVAYSLLRDIRDRGFMLAAVGRGLLTFQEANGFTKAASGELTWAEYKKSVNLRKSADSKIAKDTIGTSSGLEAAQQDRLDHSTQLFHAEVHGSRLTFTVDFSNWLQSGGPLPLVPTAPDERATSNYTTRFQEVAWMCIRLLPLLQLAEGEFGSEWEKRWSVLDESFEQALSARTGSPGEFAQIVIEMLHQKFPFSPRERPSFASSASRMKAAVSIPDPVFKAADKLARRMGVSRSRLYTIALERFVQDHDDEAITAKLNEVYANETSALDPVLQSIQSRSVK
jgi:hypothetical protein